MKAKTKLKKLLSLMLSLVMVLSILPTMGFTVYADDTTGIGTSADPYVPTTWRDFCYILGYSRECTIKLSYDLIATSNVYVKGRKHLILDGGSITYDGYNNTWKQFGFINISEDSNGNAATLTISGGTMEYGSKNEKIDDTYLYGADVAPLFAINKGGVVLVDSGTFTERDISDGDATGLFRVMQGGYLIVNGGIFNPLGKLKEHYRKYYFLGENREEQTWRYSYTLWMGEGSTTVINGGLFKNAGYTFYQGYTNRMRNGKVYDEYVYAGTFIKGAHSYLYEGTCKPSDSRLKINGGILQYEGRGAFEKKPERFEFVKEWVIRNTEENHLLMRNDEYWTAESHMEYITKYIIEFPYAMYNLIVVNPQTMTPTIKNFKINNTPVGKSLVEVTAGTNNVTFSVEPPEWIKASNCDYSVTTYVLYQDITNGIEYPVSEDSESENNPANIQLTGLKRNHSYLLKASAILDLDGKNRYADRMYVDRVSATDRLAAIQVQSPNLTGTVQYTSAPYIGQNLASVIKDLPEDLTINDLSYQWQINNGGTWSDITGATSKLYAPTANQLGKEIRLTFTSEEYPGIVVGSGITVKKLFNPKSPVTPMLEAKQDSNNNYTTIKISNYQSTQEYVYRTAPISDTSVTNWDQNPITSDTVSGLSANTTYYIYTRIKETTTTQAGIGVNYNSITLKDPVYLQKVTMKGYTDYGDGNTIYIPVGETKTINVLKTPSSATNWSWFTFGNPSLSAHYTVTSGDRAESTMPTSITLRGDTVGTSKLSAYYNGGMYYYGTWSVTVYDPADITSSNVTFTTRPTYDDITMVEGDTFTPDAPLDGLMLPTEANSQYHYEWSVYNSEGYGSYGSGTENGYIKVDPLTGKVTALSADNGGDEWKQSVTLSLVKNGESGSGWPVSEYKVTVDPALEYNLEFEPIVPVKILTDEMIAQVGKPLEQTLSAEGEPTAWFTDSTMPEGLILSADGKNLGTPTQSGVFTINVTATNVGSTDTKTFTLIINEAPSIKTDVLSDAYMGEEYNTALEAEGYPEVSWSITKGALPAGMTLATDGTISGTPTEEGSFSFTVQASNGIGDPVVKDLTLTVKEPVSVTDVNYTLIGYYSDKPVTNIIPMANTDSVTSPTEYGDDFVIFTDLNYISGSSLTSSNLEAGEQYYLGLTVKAESGYTVEGLTKENVKLNNSPAILKYEDRLYFIFELPILAEHTHSYGEWQYFGTKHWKECECGEKIELETHNYVDTIIAPTYLAQGYTLHKCSKCSYSYKDNYTDKLLLPAVTSFKASSATSSSITLTWSKVKNATGYIVYQAVDGKWKRIGKVSQNTFTVNKLSPGTTYKFAVNAYKTVDGTDVLSVSYPKLTASTKLLAVTGFKASKSTSSSITLTWSKVKNATGYIVYQAVDGKWKRIGKVSQNTFTVNKLSSGTTYKFAVNAYKTVDGTEVLSISYPKVTATTKLLAVTGFKASKTATSSITLTWSKVKNATGYIVYQAVDGKWKRIGKVSQNTFTVNKLSSGTTYKFAVNAYKTVGSTDVLSVSYPTVTTSTKPATVNFTVTSGSKKATLKWSSIKGATGYIVYYKTSSNGSWVKLATTKNLYYTKTGLTTGKTYYFTVKAYKTLNNVTYNGSYVAKSVKIK